jgi:hypothetical protein
MSRETKEVTRAVRTTLTQMGVDTQGLEIVVSGGMVRIQGELKKLKGFSELSEKLAKKLREDIAQRLRRNKHIKRVMFI